MSHGRFLREKNNDMKRNAWLAGALILVVAAVLWTAVQKGKPTADGGHDVAVTRDGTVNEFPCWSPDGQRIAFQSCRDGNFEIYVMNADGSGVRRLTDDPKFDGAPSWGVVRKYSDVR